MDAILLIFICLIVGFLLQKIKDFPLNAHKTLNQFIIFVALPAMALYYIPKIQIGLELLFPLGIAWLGFLFSFVFFFAIGNYFGWSKKLIGCLVLTSGLGNTSFLGFPIIQAIYGDEGLKTAIIVDQPGTFVVMATLGILTASFFSRGTSSEKEIVKKIFLFPPFLAFILASVMNVFNYDFVSQLQVAFLKIANTVVPIALIAVGLQIKIEKRSQDWKFLTLGLFFKLIITPAIFLVLYKLIFNGKGIVVDISILESAMAPMITGAILASNYGLKPKLSSMMIGVGIPLSFITLLFWYWILQNF